MKISIKIIGIFFVGWLLSCQKQPINNQKLSLEWGNVVNVPEKEIFTSDFILKNTTNELVDNDQWAIYFNFVREIIKSSPEVLIEHINGDLYKMTPTKMFKEQRDRDSIVISFEAKYWATSVSDAPQGPFIVFKNHENKILFKENIAYTILPFDHSKLKRKQEDNMPVADANWHYNQNNKLINLAKKDLPKIIPSPVYFKTFDTEIKLARNTTIYYQEEFKNEAQNTIEFLENNFAFKSVSKEFSNQKEKGIYLLKDITIDSKEGYQLNIDKEKIIIKAKGSAGIFYGIQSLTALFPLDNGKEIVLQKTIIEDYPRFVYRGMHLDVARHFQPKEMVKRLIKQMAFYKLNTLHFHLTDDEGWRLEIPALPELTKIGGVRSFESEKGIAPSFGSGVDRNSNGSGYYSKEDFIEILKYAQKHHVEVIPEIDMPGHIRAGIKAMKYRYDRLMVEENKAEAERFLLQDLDDQSEYSSVQRWNDNVLNPCLESTYTFIDTVVDELIKMYQEANVTLTTIHTGGDEVPDGVWEKSSICENIKGDKKNALSEIFITRFNEILKSKGLRTAGWEEIALKKVKGKFEVNHDLDKENLQPYIWNSIWGSDMQDVSYRLANAGYDVVLSNVTNLYFDLAYEKHPEEVGYYWGGYVNTKKAYEFTPENIPNCAYEDQYGNEITKESMKNFVSLTEEGKKHVLGIQGQLWSENAFTPEITEYLIYPKLIGLAERAWAKQPNWARISDKKERLKWMNIDWNVFVNQLAKNELPRLERNHINYRVPPVGLQLIGNELYANTAFPGLEIYYTTDGSEPDEKDILYTKPFPFDKTKKYGFRVKGGKEKWSRSSYFN
ncbi:beta-N-acetylhexosaminidase [Flavobacteriaceae bacterium UJ101]|nr:beta-N-acetylhexosaminidase [Flavobacteriaceae bacterium UJ101]